VEIVAPDVAPFMNIPFLKVPVFPSGPSKASIVIVGSDVPTVFQYVETIKSTLLKVFVAMLSKAVNVKTYLSGVPTNEYTHLIRFVFP
jgi:hypothetical protein